MEIPVFYRCDKPEEIKDRKIGKVTSYNKDSYEVTVKIDDQYSYMLHQLIFSEIPVSMSFRMEPAIPEKIG